MSPPEHEIILVRTQEERQQCFHIYYPPDNSEYFGSKDDSAAHFLLRLTPSMTPIGTIRCLTLTPFTYKLTRLAVLKDYRGYHFGRKLVLTLHDWAAAQARKRTEIVNDINRNTRADFTDSETGSSGKNKPAFRNTDNSPSRESAFLVLRNNTPSVKIIAHSLIPAKGFYTRFGYEPEDNQFDEDGEPHQKMVLQLPL